MKKTEFLRLLHVVDAFLKKKASYNDLKEAADEREIAGLYDL